MGEERSDFWTYSIARPSNTAASVLQPSHQHRWIDDWESFWIWAFILTAVSIAVSDAVSTKFIASRTLERGDAMDTETGTSTWICRYRWERAWDGWEMVRWQGQFRHWYEKCLKIIEIREVQTLYSPTRRYWRVRLFHHCNSLVAFEETVYGEWKAGNHWYGFG